MYNKNIILNLKYTERQDGLWDHTSLDADYRGGCCQNGSANSNYVQGERFLNQMSNY